MLGFLCRAPALAASGHARFYLGCGQFGAGAGHFHVGIKGQGHAHAALGKALGFAEQDLAQVVGHDLGNLLDFSRVAGCIEQLQVKGLSSNPESLSSESERLSSNPPDLTGNPEPLASNPADKYDEALLG